MQKLNSKIKCLIIDDEELAREGLEEYVNQVPFIELVATCASAIEAQEIVDKNKIDVCFCDINMPYLSGIDWVKSLSNPPLIVFTTAYTEYAIESYEVDALDYLLKPISFDRFYKSCLKIKENLVISDQEIEDDFIFVKVDQQIKKVWLNDIKYIESQNNYVNIVTTKESLLPLLTLKEIQKQLSDKFLKVQKSFVVNVDFVEAIEGNSIIIDKQLITVSRTQKKEIFEQLTQGKFILKK
ncbi:LytR/AlgR family response regulator transcription factor [Flammeovirga kamogawensis]|uniref:LytTR family DNA-binding domain-containing protein n=1 Tax=Flammeovirga kamogawensis TaxID=373891 RepID=A0ABX8GPI1_9BACT|nr:LytTR family DNA-binding domain-containing protein [Flammeovirga kamogawensis]MBB6463479.1 DNA-binding LytR/AlgR family response regulator [Flammeovirga kamogawensis]QWG05595.1 LytTR family DNA-binding domain-containing protein [Flammeovirga kamogawensis]TRX67427.1 response regulator transcription factor [Flammeovirga kamogawensis]